MCLRFPKSASLGRMWVKAVTKEEVWDKSFGGMVCIQHFTDNDFKRKDKSKVLLKPDAIPSIFNEIIQTEKDNIENEDINNNIELISNVGSCSKECCECLQKDQTIQSLRGNNDKLTQSNQEYMTTIDELRKKVKLLRDRSYYWESSNSKLKADLMLLEKQKLQNEKLLHALQVLISSYITSVNQEPQTKSFQLLSLIFHYVEIQK